jgi:hypothetical protein
VLRFAALLFFSLTLGQAADWSQFHRGPFEVISSKGEKQAKETLNYVEQFRYALGSQLGEPDLQTTWPIRIVIVDRREPVFPALKFGRDAWILSIPEVGAQVGSESAASLAEALLSEWRGKLPPELKRGLVSVYSTLQVDGTRVTLGTPPAQKDREWTTVHMLAVHPNYSGKLRVLLANLGRGISPEVSYRNAFSQSAEEVDRAVDKYMEAGAYQTIPAPSQAISVRQFLGKELSQEEGRLAMADLLFANSDPRAEATYQQILKAKPDSSEAQEGLGLIALRSGDRAAAKKYLENAKSAKARLEYARLTDDAAAKRAVIAQAAEANSKWAEPHKVLADLETHPAQKLAALRKAAELEPQTAQNWVALAVVQEEASQFSEAAKSWAAAERATDDPNERERIRQTRVIGQQKRDAAIRGEREAARRKAEQEIADLRNKALMEIRKAEARANAGKPTIDASTLDEYKEGPDTKKTTGVLQRVDCLGVAARLHIVSGKKTTYILVPDPSKVAITGGGESSFGCGVQKPARNVTVDYLPRSDKQRRTVGDAVTIEFQ